MAKIDTEYITALARLTILRVDACLSELGRDVSLDSFPTLKREVSKLIDEASDESSDVGDYIDTGILGRYERALVILGDYDVLHTLMNLCITEYLFPEFTVYIRNSFGYDICIYIAAIIEGKEEISFGEVNTYADIARRLMVVDIKQEPLKYARFFADARLMGFLSNDDAINSKLSNFTVLFKAEDELHEPLVNQDVINLGVALLEGGCKILCLSGTGGRRFIAKHIAKKTEMNFLFLNIADLVWWAPDKDISSLRDALIREAYISNAGICFYGFSETFIMGESTDRDKGRRDMEILAEILFAPIRADGIKLILCVDDIKLFPKRENIENVRFLVLPNTYTFNERKKLWQGLFDLYGIHLDAVSFASRYRMTPTEVANAVLSFVEESSGLDQDKESEELFARINLESIHNTDELVGRIIYSDVKLEDVKLKANNKMILRDTVNAAFRGPLIMDEWDLKSIYHYGRGVSLLMSGPPGTGKTMSANAIAGELSLPLYQVNLSNVVDKYIGETEKNLEKAFAFAEKNSVVLFFDEADALFGTRNEVHDSIDRYANNEIAYLLQRMESYDGIVLLATNKKGNIDPAFLRRIRYVVHFDKPDEEMRRQIWQGCLKETIPHKDIDVDYLASQFDAYTGSVIKTIFLNACALAARDGELTMQHIIQAIIHETEKETMVEFKVDMLGKYAYLV